MQPIIDRAGHGERFTRENRVVTIRVDRAQLWVHEITGAMLACDGGSGL